MRGRIVAAGITTGMVIAVGLFCIFIVHDQDIWLDTTGIVKEFEDQGLTLARNATMVPDNYQIGSVKPTIFDIGEDDFQLFIYEFANGNERRDLSRSELAMGNMLVDDNIVAFHESKNALIGLEYPFNDILNHEEEFATLDEKIDDIVLYNLNDTTRLVYQGSSEHWQGTMTMEYYHHYLEYDDVDLFTEGYYRMTYEIEFLGGDYQTIGPMGVAKELPSGSSERDSAHSLLDSDGWYRSKEKGNNPLNCDRDQFEITFTWQGQEETLVLVNTGVISF